MNIVIDDNSGFCFGVINAIQTAEKYLATEHTLFCLGDIVHNNEEVKRLTNLGLKIITHKEFSQLHNTKVLIRAHGEPPCTYEIAKKNNIELIDSTCHVVLQLQKNIKLCYEAEPNTQILIFGKEGHAEVTGLLGQTQQRGIVISSLKDIDRINFSIPAKLYAQTTQSMQEYHEIIQEIQKRYEENGNKYMFYYFETICKRVVNRAKEIQQFARQYDMIIFVSGEKSSNGLYLFDICQHANQNSHFISHLAQLQNIDFSAIENIGICGATSTPMWLMEEVAETLRCWEK